MSNQIDKRIVSMSFDNDKFEQNIGTSLSSLEKLKQSLNFGASGKALDGLAASAKAVDFNSLASNVETISSRFTTLGVIGVTALQNITNSAIEAGKQLYNSLFVAPKMQGFGEYELKMGSIQTIMAGTGASLETVNKKLEELNAYSDKTIYSFADMTSNIGKFTNAGVSLDDAVSAIQGVANVAALAGANSNEASRAMYNFGQAISAGHVKLIDWKSIELANMATKDFKQELINAALAAGTLKSAGKGMYKTLSGKALSATKGFNESLNEQWLTSNILTKTLTKYTDTTTELGAKATAAAQDVKTFSMMMDTLKESAGSGWAQTFEILLGDFEESKTLFTGMSNTIGGWLSATAEARNNKLQVWKDLGGRTKLIEGLVNIFKALKAIIDPVISAFKELFPPANATGAAMYALTEKFANFTSKLIVSQETTESIKNIFTALFTVIKTVIEVIEKLVKGFIDLVKAVAPSAETLKAVSSEISKFVTWITDAIRNTTLFSSGIAGLKSILVGAKTAIATFVEGLLGINNGVKSADENGGAFVTTVKSWRDVLTDIGTYLKDTFGPILTTAGNIIKQVAHWIGVAVDEIRKVFVVPAEGSGLGILNTALLGGILVGVLRFIKSFKETAGTFKSSFIDVIDGVSGSLQAFQTSIKADALKNVAIALLILAGALVIIATIEPEKLKTSMAAITIMLTELLVTLALFDKISKSGGSMAKTSGSLILLSTALTIFATALKKMSELDIDAMQKGLAGMGIILGELAVFTKFADLSSIKKMGGDLVLLSVAMIGLATALKIMGNIELVTLAIGLGTMGIILAGLAVYFRTLNTVGNIKESSSSLIAIAGAMIIFAAAIKLLGNMNPADLAIGLGSMALVMAMIGLTIKSISGPGIMGIGPAFLGISVGMVAIATAIKMLSGIPFFDLIKGIGGVVLALWGLSAVLAAYTSNVVGAGALIIVAGALVVMAGAIKILSTIPIDALKNSLIALGVALGILVAALVVLSNPAIAAGLVQVSLSMLAFGAALALIGIGVAAVSIGITALSVALLPFVAALGAALLAFIAILGPIATSLMSAIDYVLKVILEKTPSIVNSIMEIFVKILEGIALRTEEVVTAFIDIIIAVLDAITKRFPEIVDSGVKLVISFINGLADGLRNNQQQLRDAVWNIITAIIETIISLFVDIIKLGADLLAALLKGIGDHIGTVVTMAQSIIGKLIEGITSLLKTIWQVGVDVFNKIIDGLKYGIIAIWNFGTTLVGDLIKGILSVFTDIYNTGKDIVSEIMSGLGSMGSSIWNTMVDLGGNIVEGLKKGILNIGGSVARTLKNVASNAVNGVLNFFGIKSPSRLMMGIGENVDRGLIKGITSLKDKVADSGIAVAKSTANGMKKALDKTSSLINLDPEISQPVIRPILDLDAIKDGFKEIGGISTHPVLTPAFATNSANGAANTFFKMGGNILDNKAVGKDSQTVYNINVGGNYQVREELDIKKISEELAKEIERKMRG